MGRLGQFPLAQQMKLFTRFYDIHWIPIVHSLALLLLRCSASRVFGTVAFAELTICLQLRQF